MLMSLKWVIVISSILFYYRNMVCLLPFSKQEAVLLSKNFQYCF